MQLERNKTMENIIHIYITVHYICWIQMLGQLLVARITKTHFFHKFNWKSQYLHNNNTSFFKQQHTDDLATYLTNVMTPTFEISSFSVRHMFVRVWACSIDISGSGALGSNIFFLLLLFNLHKSIFVKFTPILQSTLSGKTKQHNKSTISSYKNKPKSNESPTVKSETFVRII